MTEEKTEEKVEEKKKKSFMPVIILAIVVFGIVAVLNNKSKTNVKETPTEKKSEEVKLKIDVNNDKEWANTLGYLMGKQIEPTLKDELIVKNPDDYKEYVLKGIKEAFEEKKDNEKFTDEELKKILEERGKVAKERIKKIAEENKKAGDEYVAKYEKEEGVEKTENGTLYKKITEGEGDVVGKNIAHVRYVGKHINGEEFDSSDKQGKEPVIFTSDTVSIALPGLGEALELMKKGSKWEIVLPVKSAYGEKVPPGAPFGPNEALIFELEIIDIEKPAPKSDSEKDNKKVTPKFEKVESIDTTKKSETK